MTKRHKTLEMLLERAERRGDATNGKWAVEVHRRTSAVWDDNSETICKTYTFKHYGTTVLQVEEYVNNRTGYDKHVTKPVIIKHYGQSRSDADGINAMCEHFGLPDRFSFKPVNGGFQKVAWEMAVCSICKEETEEGFIICGEIHCSEECLQETMTLEEYSKAHDMDEDDYYWTEWYGQEY